MEALDALEPPPPVMSPKHAQERFELLQERLEPLWHRIEAGNPETETIVVVPSMTLDLMQGSSTRMQPYEERFLFLLLLLRQPLARVVYVTSQPILPNVVDYYLDLLPGVIPSHARPRLFLVPVLDGSPRPLTLKLLERPRLMERIRDLIPRQDRAHLVPYNTTEIERDLAVRLGIPMYGADPRYFHFGTKTGCRQLFREEGVVHPFGTESLTCIDDVIDAIVELRSHRPDITRALVKLNEGVSGEGNAHVDLTGVPAPGAPDERDRLRVAIETMEFEMAHATYDDYVDKLTTRGAVLEERIEGRDFRSPSAQLRITPLGDIEIVSTHDQLLGGPTGQSYLGCLFPASPEYAPAITREAQKVGERLAKEGVIGRFAIDFVVVRNDADEWDVYAIEINLRKGGTTHPFLTLQFLTDGQYDPEAAKFIAPSGKAKYFIASDHIESPYFRGLTPDDLFSIVVLHKLNFDASRQTGVVFHMMAALTEDGHFGLTAVGDSPEEARDLYDKAVEMLLEDARESLSERPLPEVD